MNQPEMIVQVVRSGNRLNAFDSNGVKHTGNITLRARKKAESSSGYLGKFLMKSGNYRWKVISADDMNTTTADTTADTTSVDLPTEHAEVMNFIHSSYSLKPAGLVMSELKWKYLIRSAVRSKNIMMTGPAGCGKTICLLYTSPSPRDLSTSRMPSSA